MNWLYRLRASLAALLIASGEALEPPVDDARPILARYRVRASRNRGRKRAIWYCTQEWEARRLRDTLQRASWDFVEAIDLHTEEALGETREEIFS